VLKIFKATFKDFKKDECGTRAAALAYYTIFALPPLLMVVVTIAGRIWSQDEVQRALEGQFSGVVGQGGGQQIHQIIAHGAQSIGGGLFAMVAGIVGLILGATGAFLSLQDALNHAWEVRPDPKQGGIKNMMMKRLLSFGMVLGLGFLLAVSLALSAGISALVGAIGGAAAVLHVADFIVSLGILTVLFAALFKFLPDARIAWRGVWIGGFATSVLFVVGKVVIGLYLGHSHPGNAFGAASAFAVILIWVYYAGLIILIGAEFTQEWATHRGHGVEPKQGAVRMVQQDVEIGSGRRLPVAANDDARAGGARAGERRPAHGGIADWIIGLPALYFLLKSRGGRPRKI
jgi:membrane protein